MNNNRLPLYVIFVLVAVAIIWRISSPPPKALPGPVGPFGGWKSSRTIGEMGAYAVNPAGALWAGAWNHKEPAANTTSSAIRIIDFNSHSGKSCALPNGIEVYYLSWANDRIIRVCFSTVSDPDKGLGLILVDAVEGKIKDEPVYCSDIKRVVYWPEATSTLIAQTDDEPACVASFKFAGFEKPDESGESLFSIIGEPIPIPGEDAGNLYKDAGIVNSGSTFVFSVNDDEAKGGRAYYMSDAYTASADKIFELDDVPGRILHIWPAPMEALILCGVGQKLHLVIYDVQTHKIIDKPNGVGDITIWPEAPEKIPYTSYDGGFELDLATGKSKAAFDLSKRNSDDEKTWRDMIRGSTFYKLKDGNFVTISEVGGLVDIRELKPNGMWYRDVLSRN